MSSFVPYREPHHVHNDLADPLTRLLGPGRVLTSRTELAAYEYDASQERGRPDVVALPETSQEVAEIARLAGRMGVPLVARGAGTSLSGGPVAPRGGIVVHLSRMNRVYDLDPGNRRVVVGPGVPNNRINEVAAPHGLHFAPDPSSFRVSTVGGNIAENSGGLHALKYGVTSHHVLGLEVVLPSGDVITVGSKADGMPGYDLVGLFTGSEGTLGVITRAILRLTPLPEATETLLATYTDVAPAADTVSEIIGRGIVPAALEMMDRATIEVVEESFGLSYGAGVRAALIIEVDGERETIAAQRDRITTICRDYGCLSVEATSDPVERDRLWYGRRASYAALARLGESMIVCDGTVPRDVLGDVVPAMERLAAAYGLSYSNTFHAGDGNLHPKLMFDERNPRSVVAMRIVSRRLLEMCVEAGGTITGEHGVGSEKTAALGLVFGPSEMDLMRRIRRVFDPEARANPGKTFDEPPARAARAAPQGMGSPEEALRRVVGPENVAAEGDVCARYALDGITPRLVVTPETVEQVAAAVRVCREAGAAVAVVGHGGRSRGHGLLTALGVVLTTEKLARVKEFRPRNLTLTVEAGVSAASAQALVNEAGLRLPLGEDPAPDATFGSLVARAASGPLEHAFGPLRHRVLGMTAVLGDGSIVRLGGICMKNVAGYDVGKLLVGSLGTLAVLCDVTIRLSPLPAAREVVSAEFGSLGGALDAARELRRSHIEPEAIELCSGSGDAEGGRGPWTVRALAAGAPEDVARRVATCRDTYVTHGGRQASGPRVPVGNGVFHMALEARVPPASVDELAALLPAQAERYGVCWAATMGVGTGHVRIGSCRADRSRPDGTPAFAVALTQLAEALQGHAAVVDGQPEVRRAWAEAAAAPSAAHWMRGVKTTMDPDGLMCPGRLPWLTG